MSECLPRLTFVHCVSFAVHNEIGMTSVNREVRCHPGRILAFTLLGVCIIMQGLLTPIMGNTAALREDNA